MKFFITKIVAKRNLEPSTIFKALNLIKNLHAGQKRKSGEPFYLHPIAVTEIVLGFSQETTMIVASLLHDVVEDSHTSLAQVELLFGSEVANLVDQLTKLGGGLMKLNLSAAERHHKLTNGGKQAIQIKLADRLHNMRTIGCFGIAKQKRKAEETLKYYLPLANLVGLPHLGEELTKIVDRVGALPL